MTTVTRVRPMQLWCLEQPMLVYLPHYPSSPPSPSTHPWGELQLLVWISIFPYFHEHIFGRTALVVVVSLQEVRDEKAEERLIKIFPPQAEIKSVSFVSNQPEKWDWESLQEQNGSQGKHKAFQSTWTTAYCEICLLPQPTKENHGNQWWWKNR